MIYVVSYLYNFLILANNLQYLYLFIFQIKMDKGSAPPYEPSQMQQVRTLRAKPNATGSAPPYEPRQMQQVRTLRAKPNSIGSVPL